MKLLLAILVCIACITVLRDQIKKYSVLFYFAAIAISVITIYIPIDVYPSWMKYLIVNYVTRGVIATALFVIVMYAVLMPKKSYLQRVFMSLRGELAIIASLVTISHNISYGIMFKNAIRTQAVQRVAAVLSLMMIFLLIPLTLTSFKCVRTRMKAKQWKQIQRSSYLFYGLLYCHVAILFLPRVIAGNINYMIDLGIYTLLFGVYGVLRIAKYKKKKNEKMAKVFSIVGVGMVVLLCGFLVMSQCMQNAIITRERTVKGKYEDGTFTGEGMGYNGKTKVEVTVSNGRISGINVLDYVDDETFFSKAWEKVVQAIIEEQSTEVDAVSGATYSSKGILAAVEDAME